MSKYINTDDCETYFETHLDASGVAGAMSAIQEMPAADVTPVTHAKWINIEIFTDGYSKATCSHCTAVIKRDNLTPHTHFCSNCGAKMDLV